MNKKKLFAIMFIVVSISFIFTGSVAYYNVTVNGNINVTTGNAVFNITGFTNESTKEIILKEGALAPGDFGSFNLHLDASGSNVDMYVTLSIDKGTLPTNLKFYTTSDYKSELHKYYEFMDASNQTKDITIYWYWDPFISDEEDNKFINSYDLTATVNVSAVQISEYAMMKNGSNVTYKNENSSILNGTEFWNETYRLGIKTITFDNNLSNLPSSCTGDSDLCWDVSYDSNQDNKVYAYLIDSGLDYTDSNSVTRDLYNLYIVSEVPIYAPIDSSDIFKYFRVCTTINFNDNFNTSKVTDMGYMFDGCDELTSLDLSNFNTSKVTNMYAMFYGFKYITNLNLSSFNTSKVTNMGRMFSNCKALTNLNLSNFDTSNVSNMRYMFFYCPSLTNLDVSSFNTSKVTNMYAMFYKCSNLTSLDLSSFNTSSVTDMTQMFYNCSSLTSLGLSSFNTSSVTNMTQMFYNCSSLTSLDLSSFNTSSVTRMGSMFDGCSSLTSLDLSSFNTSSVTHMSYMFYNCSSLTTTINIMSAGVTSYAAMFDGAATNIGAQITVNYIADASTLVNNMIVTKSSTSNVVKGSQI